MFEQYVNILALLCSLGYNDACTDRPPVYPTEGTVIEAYCAGTTFVEIVADGEGGNNEIREDNSTQCGFEGHPPEGTLLKSGCSAEYPGIKWFQYADGEGGTYTEKDKYSTECGYSRTLTLTLEQEVGDRFTPAVVDVNYVNNRGDDEPWGMADSSTTLGYAERVGLNKVLIWGDGRTGDGIFTLGREEIQFRMEPEPTCDVSDGLDCQGYRQRTNESMIYYGEDDEFVVTWELAILIYTRGDTVEIIGDATEYQWERWEKRVEQYNEVYEKSGVHIRYELVELKQATFSQLGDLQNLRRQLNVDIVLGHGTSYSGTCGVARVTTFFRENYPPVSLSKCDIYTDLHELGHSVGLAHGPENQSNEAVGYIFPEFGHGWNDICGRYDDLMSYGYEGNFHSNENLYCSDVFPQDTAQVAGSRQWTDTAYSLNRVRYEVSLIHDENKYVDENEALRSILVEAERIEIEVID